MSRCQQAVVVGAFATHCGTELDPVGRRAYGNHVDHAADGARSVEVADAAANKLNVADGELGLLLPVNPSAERIIERDIVLGNESAAGGSGTESAKADALRSGIGHERAGTAEKLDAGKLAQLVIEGEAGGGAQRLLSKQARSDRALQNAKRSAISGHGDLVDVRDRRRLGVRRGLGCGWSLRWSLSGECRENDGERCPANDRFEWEPPHALGSQGWGKRLLNHFDAAERNLRQRCGSQGNSAD